MNNKNIKYKITELVKLNLNMCNLSKKIMFSIIVFSILVYFMSSNLLKESYNYNLNLNIWDGIFRNITYSTLILGFYFPYILVITTFFNTKSDYLKFIMLRSNQKKNWILSKIISSFVISFLFTISFFIIIFVVNFLMFNFESTWSEVILNRESLKLVSILYPNFFVYTINPLESFLISFLQIFITLLIILNIRDLLINYIKSKNISYALMSIYLIINIIIDSYGVNEGIFIINEYIGLGTISSIFKHKFKIDYGFTTTLGSSIIISLIFALIIICLNLAFSRKALIEDD